MTKQEWSWADARFHLSWPALFGGLFAAAGVWLMWMLLGSAVGVSSLDATDGEGAQVVGIGTGVWWVLASIAGLGIGGLVTTRCAGIIGRSHGALHGVVLWGFATTLTLVVSLALANSVATGIGSLNPLASARNGGGALARTLDVNADDILEPINACLRQEGKSTVTVRELQATVDDALNTAITRGGYDWAAFRAALSRNTGISERDLDQALATTHSELQQRLRAASEQAADVTQIILWSLFAMMALSLGAALAGAVAGVSREQRDLAHGAPMPPPGAVLDPATGVPR